MSVTVEIRREGLKARDAKSFFEKLNAQYPGKWIAILENGDLVVQDRLAQIYEESEKKASKVLAMFRASKKGQLLYK